MHLNIFFIKVFSMKKKADMKEIIAVTVKTDLK